MSALRLGLVALLGVAACQGGQTVGEAHEQNRASGTKLLAGLNAAREAIKAAPPPAVGATCTHLGMTPSRMGESEQPDLTGNTEMLDWMWLLVGPDHSAATGNPSNRPILGWGATASAIAHSYAPNEEMMPSASRRKADPVTLARYQAAAKVEHLLVARDTHGRRYELFFVDFPAGTLECSFAVTSPLEEHFKKSEPFGYDLRTGELLQVEKGQDDTLQADLHASLRHEVQSRFGLSLGSGDPFDAGAPADGPSALALQERAKKTLAALNTPKLPACKGATAEAPRITRKRLVLAAGAPPLPKSAINANVEPADLISPTVQTFLMATGAPRETAAKSLVAAPIWLVLDVVAAELAFETSADRFRPGTLVARQVPVDANGKALCETKIEVENSASLDFSHYASTKALELQRASRADLVKHFAEKLTAAH